MVGFTTGIRVSGTTHVELGASIRLLCNVSAGLVVDWNPSSLPPVDADWYRAAGSTSAAAAIRSNRRSGIAVAKKVDVLGGSAQQQQHQYLVVTLVVEASRAEHAGEYVCRSTAGQAETIAVYLHYGLCFRFCLGIVTTIEQ